MLNRRFLLAGGCLASAIVIAGVVWLLINRSGEGADPTDPQLIVLGRSVYAQQCASCHGTNLEGQANWKERLPNGRLPAPPHDASGHTWHHPDKQLFEITKNGASGILPGYESDMPAFRGILSDHEIWAALAYIKSTWPDDIRMRQERINKQSEARQSADQ
jgi:mono/diheme cytochrome c family protein